jgi:hypothetical protein
MRWSVKTQLLSRFPGAVRFAAARFAAARFAAAGTASSCLEPQVTSLSTESRSGMTWWSLGVESSKE